MNLASPQLKARCSRRLDSAQSKAANLRAGVGQPRLLYPKGTLGQRGRFLVPVGQAGRTTITQAGLMLRFVRNTFSGSHVVFDELPDCPVKRRLGAFSAFVLGEEVDVGTRPSRTTSGRWLCHSTLSQANLLTPTCSSAARSVPTRRSYREAPLSSDPRLPGHRVFSVSQLQRKPHSKATESRKQEKGGLRLGVGPRMGKLVH